MKQLKHIRALVALMAFWLFYGGSLNAQISEGGTPPSFAYPSTQSYAQPSIIRPAADIEQLKAEDKQRESNNMPLRASTIISTDFSINNSGQWTVLPDGQHVWRLNISSPGAIALMLYYDEFYIPEGAKLFIYNESKNHVIGAYTNNTNPKVGSFATEFVAGDNIILEYVAPLGANFSPDVALNKGSIPRIKISGIGYGYNYLNIYYRKNGGLETYAFGESGSCMVNINCAEGDNWQDQKRGVAKSITKIGGSGYLCSGTVINNTAQNLTPYFLTAQHCFYDGVVKTTGNEWNQILYYFHYESPNCSNPGADPVALSKTMTGAQLLVELPIGGSSDGVLLKLNDNIPLDYNVYYNGWDRSNTPATSGVGIHHPKGDIKKISTYTAPAESTIWNGAATGAPNAHWNIIFTATPNGHSVTEGGSSGSPMFNQNGLVVGTLSGGNSSCTALSGRNLYGKLWYHWDNNNIVDPAKTMRHYLDPLSTGQETLGGTYIPQVLGAAFGASATDIYVLQSITYTNYTVTANSYEWTFEGGTPASSTEKDPLAVTYNTLGVFETKLVINKGTAEEVEASKTITVTEKGDNPVAPIAQFAIGSLQPLFEEGFDVAVVTDFPPTGWIVEKPGASVNQWKASNPGGETPKFDIIDPSSTFSAMVACDENNIIETWLKMDSDYTIPSYGVLDFYAGYSGSWLSGGYLTLYASTDGGTTWPDELWTNGPNNIAGLGWAWRKQTIYLAAYAGQSVRFAWRYYGQDGDFAGVDGIKISAYKPDEKLSINVGDYIKPVDLSTGPPILYEWSFPGGEPETSDKENPSKLRYMTPGTYDVALKVKNYRGEDSRTLSNAVTVIELIPVAAYEASVSYTRRENSGLFLPTGTEVDFTDKSFNYPSSWEWTFEGGEPASSTQQNPNTVKFNTEGEFDFKFKAINGGGNDEIAITKGTKVGYTRDTIWNLGYGEKDSRAMYSYGSGYVTGTNTNDITSYAEKFDAPLAEAAISAVKVNLLAAGANNSHHLQVGIAKVGSDGLPGAIIASATLPLSAVSQTAIANDKPTLVEFDVPVAINEPYFVLVGDPTGGGGNFDNPGYTAVIITSANRSTEGKNTVYWFDSYYAKWESLSGKFVNFNISMDIAPVLTYAQHEGIDAKKFIFKNIDPTVATVNMKTNLPWKATTDAYWINIANANGDGNGAFTFTVDNNKYNPRKAIIKVSAGDAYTDYILLMQAGPNPDDLTAVVTNEDAGGISLTWEAPKIVQPYKPGDNIFEDAEEHPDFLNASPGYYGWKYLDLDAQTTFGIKGISFPGSQKPSSFRVFTPSKTTPASNASFNSHDGSKKYFAAFAADNSTITNDWMISPKLGFTEQFKVSFWARSYSGSYPEHLRVLYSTTGNGSADFNNELTTTPYQILPAAWTRYEYTLPANATHVAFNCVSNDAFIMFIDNIFIGIGDAPLSERELTPSSDELEIKAAVEVVRKSGNSKKMRMNEFAGIDIKALSAEKVLEFKNEVTGETFEVVQKARVSKEEQLVPKFEAANKEDKQQVLTDELDALNDTQSLPTAKLRYDDGINVNTIGFNTTADVPIEVAIRFTPTELLAYQGAKMKAVDVYLKGVPSDGITIKVRQGDMVYRQHVASLAAEKFTRISLNKELHIDAVEDLYISYEFVQRNKQYVGGVGKGPAVIGKGDLIATQGGALESLYDISGGGLDYNWNIALLVEDNKDVVEIKYNVYRGNTLIKTVNETNLVDVLATQNNACYEVSALYSGNIESTRSNTSCVTLKNLLTVGVSDTSRYVGEANPIVMPYVSGTLLPGHTYNDIISLCGIECLADVQSVPGTYPITVKPLTHSDYRFAYQHGTLTIKPSPTLSGAPVLSGAVVNDVNIQLDWTAVSGAARYVIYRAGVEIATVTELSYSDNTLIYGTYCYTVKGVSSTGVESGISNEVCNTVKQLLTISIEDATRYVGEANPSFKPSIIGALLPGHTYDHILSLCGIECLADGQSVPGTYPITVKSITHNDYYFIYQHGTLTVLAPATLSGAPVLSGAVVNDVNIQLDWTAVSGAARYVIYRAGVEIATVTELSYSDNTLIYGTYCYTVKGVSSTGVESGISNEVCNTVKQLLTISIEDATRYVGEANPSFKPYIIGALLPGHTYDHILSLCTIECLADGQSTPGTYPITVKPITHSDYRFIYQPGTLTVLPATALSGAPVLTGTIVNDVNIQLDWTAVSGAARYVIYRAGVEIATVTELSYSDNTLIYGTYCYTVKGVSSTGVESGISNEVCNTVKQLLTISIEDATRYVGEANPSFKPYIIGALLPGHTYDHILSLCGIECLADGQSVPGTYPITVKPITHSDYRFIYQPGTLTVLPATALSGAPVLTGTIVNDVNIQLNWTTVLGAERYIIYREGVEIASVSWLGYSDNTLTPGTYCYKVKGVGSTGIESEISNEVCATVKYLLTVGVEDANRYFGEANPSFKLTYSGFVAGDTEETLSTKPVATSDATLLSVAGTYPIIVSGGESSKYRFVYNNGSLIIKSRTDQTNPNAFTPYEKDGINDIFLPGAKIEVVNRYGQHIFNGNNGWDGTRKNGQLVSPGTYYYKATLSDRKTHRGSVEVIKKK